MIKQYGQLTYEPKSIYILFESRRDDPFVANGRNNKQSSVGAYR